MAKHVRKADEMLELFKTARVFGMERFQKYQENQAFYENEENLLPSYNPDKIWSHNINVPYASLNIIKVVSSLQSQDFAGVLKPYTVESADLIDRLNKVVQDVWKEADIDQEVNDAIEGAAVLREHYTHIIFEESPHHRNRGRIKAYAVNPASVVIDPHAKSLREADYVFIAEALSEQKIKDLYPKQFNKLKKTGRHLNQQETGEATYVSTTGGLPNKENDLYTRLTMYEMINGTVYKTVTVNDVVVEETFDMEINNYPIAQLRWQPKMNSPYGISLIEKMIPSQKAVNEIESATANAALMWSSPSLLLDLNAGISPEEFAMIVSMPSAVVGVDSNFTGGNLDNIVKPILPNKNLDEGLLSIRLQQIETMREIAGISEEFEGAIGTAGNTSSGAREAINRAKITEERFKKQLAYYIEHLARIIADIVVKEYRVVNNGDYITQASLDEQGELSFTTVDLSDIDLEEYRYTPYGFYVNLDNLGGNSREASYQKLLELMQLERQYGGQNEDFEATVKVMDLIQMMDFERKDEILARNVAKETMTTEKIAETVVELTTAALEFGVDESLLNAAISEVVSRDLEMKALGEFLAEVDRLAEEQAQMEQAVLSEDAAMLERQLQEEEQMLLQQEQAQLAQIQAEKRMLGEGMADMEIEIDMGEEADTVEEADIAELLADEEIEIEM